MSSKAFDRGKQDRFLVVGALAVGLIAALRASAPVQQLEAETQEMKLDPSFRPLFNGKDLTAPGARRSQRERLRRDFAIFKSKSSKFLGHL
jgi:hypothetical protein